MEIFSWVVRAPGKINMMIFGEHKKDQYEDFWKIALRKK